MVLLPHVPDLETGEFHADSATPTSGRPPLGKNVAFWSWKFMATSLLSWVPHTYWIGSEIYYKMCLYTWEIHGTILVGGWAYPSDKYESQLGWLFPRYEKIKNVPNHQPEEATTATKVKKPKSQKLFKQPQTGKPKNKNQKIAILRKYSSVAKSPVACRYSPT